MKKIIFVSGILLISKLFAQGLILDPNNYGKLKKWDQSENFGFAESFPSKISYRKYTPPVLDQGQTSTCVGYSVAYGLLTTQQNILMGITDENMKYFRAMDPNFVYALIKSNDDQWCQQGTSMFDAIGVLINQGCKPMFFDPWLECNATTSISNFAMTAASTYKVSDAYILSMEKSDIVEIMKSALVDKRLISIGAKLTPSFKSGKTVQFGSWTPSLNESFTGGHAMVIIGYDDLKNGGSFEVMNSWGPNFGDQGFVWIKYSDVKNYINEAYVLKIDDFSLSNCGFGDCTNSVSRYRYPSGNAYEGLIKNNYPDIYGSYFYTSGNFYVGEFSKGKKHGYGLFYENLLDQFFLTYYENDILINKSNIQGFSDDSEKLEKTLKLYEKLNLIKPAKLIKENDKAFEILLDMEIPVEDMKINH
jgi:hypothetical protein